MPMAPDGTIINELSDDETGGAVGSTEREKEAEGHSGTKPVGGAGARPRKECRPQSPSPIDELIAALCKATLGPARPRRHGLDPLPDNRPKVKIQPPLFKGLPGERPDAHLLAAADWMEAM